MIRIRRICADHPIMILFIFFVLFASVVSRCNLLDPFKFLIVQLAFVYLPGCAIQKLVSISYQNGLIRRLVAYITGYALSITIYLALLMMNLQSLVLYVYCIVFVVSAVYFWGGKTKTYNKGTKTKELYIFAIILALSWAISFILFQCINLSPMLKDGHIPFFQDLVFWLRNAVASTKGYPLPDMSVLDNNLFYHYF